MKAFISFMVTVCILLTGCSAKSAVNPELVQTEVATSTPMIELTATALPTNTPAPTATAIPVTATATSNPFAELNMDNLLFQNNDLAVGFSGGQILHTYPPAFSGIPLPDYVIYQLLQKDNGSGGYVTVLFYGDQYAVDTAYSFLDSKMGNLEEVPGDWIKGELSIFTVTSPTSNLSFLEAIFDNCHFVLKMRFPEIEKSKVIAYAKAVDQRLLPLICK
jgi:hypothetical protein